MASFDGVLDVAGKAVCPDPLPRLGTTINNTKTAATHTHQRFSSGFFGGGRGAIQGPGCAGPGGCGEAYGGAVHGPGRAGPGGWDPGCGGNPGGGGWDIPGGRFHGRTQYIGFHYTGSIRCHRSWPPPTRDYRRLLHPIEIGVIAKRLNIPIVKVHALC